MSGVNIFTTNEIEEQDLNYIPGFITSPAGNPYVSETNKSNSRTGFLKIEKILTFEGTLTGFPYLYTTITITHNLGRYPFPMGEVYIGGEVDSFVPLPYPGSAGVPYITTYSAIEKDTISVYIWINTFLGASELDVKGKLYLLRETL